MGSALTQYVPSSFRMLRSVINKCRLLSCQDEIGATLRVLWTVWSCLLSYQSVSALHSCIAVVLWLLQL